MQVTDLEQEFDAFWVRKLNANTVPRKMRKTDGIPRRDRLNLVQDAIRSVQAFDEEAASMAPSAASSLAMKVLAVLP
jgi:hypothetical protein